MSSFFKDGKWRRVLPAVRVIASLARARYQLRGARLGARVRCGGRLVVSQPHGLAVGSRVVFMEGVIPTQLWCAPGATLEIGAHSLFNYGVTLSARQSVRIGERCMFGSLVHLADDDGRTVAPIVIGDDVWVAHGAVIEPGSTIGDGAVIAAGAVVSGHVPAGHLATGNPARWLPLEHEPSAPPPPAEAKAPPARVVATPSPRAEVREAIIEWLDETRCFGSARAQLTDDAAPLRAQGLLDSLGAVELVTMLEERFSVSIGREHLREATGYSLDDFIALVPAATAAGTSVPQRAQPTEEADAAPLHRADLAAPSQLASFARYVEQHTGVKVDGYARLHAFSVAEVERFWELFLSWSGAPVSGALHPVTTGGGVETTRFFPEVRLSWVENLLAKGDEAAEQAPALIAVDESGARRVISRAGLRRQVRAAAAALQARGLGPSDRVVAVASNTVETVVSCLAVTSLGATWSSVAPDLGLAGALARFEALEPRLLFAHRSFTSNGVRSDTPTAELQRALPSLQHLVTLDGSDPGSLAALVREGEGLAVADDAPWPRFAFDHPLFIVFSSGTTGRPKCIVHGHGGTLLEHLKEHRLHCDLGPHDRLLFQTTTGWMMWNWAVSALATGATVVLYEGSVSHPRADSLLSVAAREGVTVFGTSPAWLQYARDAELGTRTRFRQVLSTGSVLPAPLHRWASERFAPAAVNSISGGTDILGCFVLNSPWSDVHAGESSCISLGLDVRALSQGVVQKQGDGELVCVTPFPSRPVGLFDDPGGERFHAAYFSAHPGVWNHGDLIHLSRRGSVRVRGRCDGVLNIRGVRIGPAELYEILARRIEPVAQAMAVDEDAPDEPGERRLLLFVKLRPGHTLDPSLRRDIKLALKTDGSPNHVPAVIVQVDELPMTSNGKLSEAALQDALHGRAVRNRAALKNPGAIDRALAARRQLAPEAEPVTGTLKLAG
ncbi:MAG: acetoacetate--CoA ligase [Archangiaceae bacterium]|nr:acetoacetate--CoA ligase [Archangiaceae bacterium]